MMIDRAPRKAKPIPLTPLIDVVFLLVVFFMVTTSFIKIEAIELNLPSAGKQKSGRASSNNASEQMLNTLLVVDVEKTGRVFVNQQAIEQQALERTLRTAMKDKKQKFLVRVGDAVSVQQLVEIMDIVHLSGGRDIAVSEWDGAVSLSAEARQRISKEISEPVILPEQGVGGGQ